MSGERILPGLGIKAFWTAASDGWDSENDNNLRILSATTQLTVLSRVASVPGSPTAGDIYLLTSGGNDKKIAIYDVSTWIYLTPKEGWTCFVSDVNKYYFFDGTVWVGMLTDADITAAIAAISTVQPVLHVRDERVSGTDGGTATAGAWQTRTLNTIVVNELGGSPLLANQITLGAGYYEIHARSPASSAGAHQCRLRNITDGVTAKVGSNSSIDSVIHSKMQLTGTKVFELQDRVTTTRATDGFGVHNGFGEVEVYAEVMIRKVS